MLWQYYIFYAQHVFQIFQVTRSSRNTALRSSAHSVSCISLPKWIFSLHRHFWPSLPDRSLWWADDSWCCRWWMALEGQGSLYKAQPRDCSEGGDGTKSKTTPWIAWITKSTCREVQHLSCCVMLRYATFRPQLPAKIQRNAWRAWCFCTGTGKQCDEWPKVESNGPNIEASRSSERATSHGGRRKQIEARYGGFLNY